MYKDHLLQNIEREILLLKRLAALIEEKDLEFRLADKTRNTIELMRYLSSVGSVMLRWFVKNDFNKEEWEKIAAHRSTLTIENFPSRIDEQWEAIKAYMAEISEEDLMNKEVELPWKEKMPLGSAIINAPIKWMATYRMQLFLYLKMNGRPQLGTPEAWRPVIAAPAV